VESQVNFLHLITVIINPLKTEVQSSARIGLDDQSHWPNHMGYQPVATTGQLVVSTPNCATSAVALPSVPYVALPVKALHVILLFSVSGTDQVQLPP